MSVKYVVIISGMIPAWEFWQVSDRKSPVVGYLRLIYYLFKHYLLLSKIFFQLMKLYITRSHYELSCNTEILAKLDKKVRN